MHKSPHLNLNLTPEITDENFLSWRLKENGLAGDSNMMILDAAAGALQEWQDEKDTTPFTWGMLKNGLRGGQA